MLVFLTIVYGAEDWALASEHVRCQKWQGRWQDVHTSKSQKEYWCIQPYWHIMGILNMTNQCQWNCLERLMGMHEYRIPQATTPRCEEVLDVREGPGACFGSSLAHEEWGRERTGSGRRKEKNKLKQSYTWSYRGRNDYQQNKKKNINSFNCNINIDNYNINKNSVEWIMKNYIIIGSFYTQSICWWTKLWM